MGEGGGGRERVGEEKRRGGGERKGGRGRKEEREENEGQGEGGQSNKGYNERTLHLLTFSILAFSAFKSWYRSNISGSCGNINNRVVYVMLSVCHSLSTGSAQLYGQFWSTVNSILCCNRYSHSSPSSPSTHTQTHPPPSTHTQTHPPPSTHTHPYHSSDNIFSSSFLLFYFFLQLLSLQFFPSV